MFTVTEFWAEMDVVFEHLKLEREMVGVLLEGLGSDTSTPCAMFRQGQLDGLHAVTCFALDAAVYLDVGGEREPETLYRKLNVVMRRELGRWGRERNTCWSEGLESAAWYRAGGMQSLSEFLLWLFGREVER